MSVWDLLGALAATSAEDGERVAAAAAPAPAPEPSLVALLLERFAWDGALALGGDEAVAPVRLPRKRPSHDIRRLRAPRAAGALPGDVDGDLFDGDDDASDGDDGAPSDAWARISRGGAAAPRARPAPRDPRGDARPLDVRAARLKADAARVAALVKSPPELRSLPDGRHVHRARTLYCDFGRDRRGPPRPRASFDSAAAPPARGSASTLGGASAGARPPRAPGDGARALPAFAPGSRARTANRAASRRHKHVHLSPAGDSAVLRPLVPSPPPRRTIFSREEPPRRRPATTGERVFFKPAAARIRPLHLLAPRADWAVDAAIRGARGL